MDETLRTTTVHFGVFEADLRNCELRKHGIRIALQDQPFKLLTVLTERPGEVVTREELRRRLWSSDISVDVERGLNTAVMKLRRALSDSADRPRYVETVPRHGYRFIASVRKQVVTSDVREAPVRRWKLWLAFLGLLAGTVAVILFIHLRSSGPELVRTVTLAGAGNRDRDIFVMPIRKIGNHAGNRSAASAALA